MLFSIPKMLLGCLPRLFGAPSEYVRRNVSRRFNCVSVFGSCKSRSSSSWATVLSRLVDPG